MAETNTINSVSEANTKIEKVLAALQPPYGQQYLLSVIHKTEGQIWPIAAFPQKEEGEVAQKRLNALLTEDNWCTNLTLLCSPLQIAREGTKQLRPSNLLPPPKVRGAVIRLKDA